MVRSPRRCVVVSGLVLVAAAGVVVAVRCTGPGSIRAAGWGGTARWTRWSPVARQLPWLRVPRTETVEFHQDCVWAVVDGGSFVQPKLQFPCGCRMDVDPEDAPLGSIPIWTQIPATARNVVVVSDCGGAVVDSLRLELPPGRPSGRTPDRPVVQIPRSGIVGDLRYTIREVKGQVTVALRSSGNGAAARRRAILVRDAEGRVVRWPAGRMLGLGSSWMPFGRYLCPHGPWWELEFTNPGAEPTVLRFACPKQPATQGR